MDTVSYFAHNVNDIAVVSQVLYGKDNKDFTSVDVEIKDIASLKPNKIAFLDIDNSLLSDYVAQEYKSLLKFFQIHKFQ